MRFRLSLITMSLVVCALPTFGQQVSMTPSARPLNCLSAPALPQPRGVIRPHVNQPCKPASSVSERDRKHLNPFTDNATYVSFDFPGYLSGITANGTVVGGYSDSNNVDHGWLRNPDGTTMSFADPSAVYGTDAYGVNNAGVITGLFVDTSGAHGFLRTPSGTYTSFDVPGAADTAGNAINAGGSVAGYYADADFNLFGFVREPQGTITTFNIPGVFGFPVAVNPMGLILGWDFDSNYTAHGFLRDQNGAMATIDPPANTGITLGGFSPDGGTLALNQEGRVAGTYWQPIPGNPFGGNNQGFVRHTDGSFETFVAANYGPCCIWSWATGIGPDSTVVGYENDGYNENHGYLRRRDGTVTLFDEPDAGNGDFQGTFPIAISTNGVILGVYWDSNFILHGFLRMPPQ